MYATNVKHFLKKVPIILQEVVAMIKPAIPVETVPDFLWQHILHDLDVLAAAIGKSPDDCVTLIHLLLNAMPKANFNKGMNVFSWCVFCMFML